jgi:hypothetical protein
MDPDTERLIAKTIDRYHLSPEHPTGIMESRGSIEPEVKTLTGKANNCASLAIKAEHVAFVLNLCVIRAKKQWAL